MPDWGTVATSSVVLGVGCVVSGFLTTASQQWAAHANTTGRHGSRMHTFDHSFFMQTFLFLGQLSCLGLHSIIRKVRGPQPPGDEEQEEPVGRVAAQMRARARHNQEGNRKQNPQAGNERSIEEELNHGAAVRVRARGREDKAANEVADNGPGKEHAADGEAIGGPVADIQVEETEEGLRQRRQREQREQMIREAGPRRGPRLARKMKPKDKKEYNKIIFLPCALCDFARTGLLFIGLRQTFPSSFIMLQGVGLLATCTLTVAFVGREKTVRKLQWVGASICAVGLAVIGLRDYVWGKDHTYDPYGIAAGDLLIVMAQLMTSIQVILEQRFVKKHDIDPLVAIGLEGMFGFILLIILLIPFYFVDVGAFNTLPKHRLEDPYDAFCQMQMDYSIIAAFLGSVLFWPLYYYCGLSITKHVNAVTRMGVDINIQMLTWAVYIMAQWQAFHASQILGFGVFIVGIIVFFLDADPIIARFQGWRERRREGNGENEPLNPTNPVIQDYGIQEQVQPRRNRPR
ncbi:solute carrier family 35 member F6-like [Haliotis rufescens]|uniref:solute carrier family 35 member F6-like n=1 Tax=Haliotis rufescens TaxID=6454 RepID=UPI001EAFDA1E|nr:solute carrier family 35 member F6-like [Haliotis rufescens]XP_046335262.1 solute carrier family 35 member F6-like [Haliotis rufescens]